MSTPDLSTAYALRSAQDCARLYAEWADTYDRDFGAAMDYRLPAHVAAAWLAHGGIGPVLDVGAGTGLLGAALRAQGFAGAIDGLDLSAEMLGQARTKNLYRRLMQADVTRGLAPGGWHGVVSSGTFTHGHVGPGAITALLDAAEPGALFALSVNTGIWDAQDFDGALAALGPRIGDLVCLDVPIYGPAAADPGHAADRARIVMFRRR